MSGARWGEVAKGDVVRKHCAKHGRSCEARVESIWPHKNQALVVYQVLPLCHDAAPSAGVVRVVDAVEVIR